MALNMQEPWSWTEADLQSLISDGVTESLSLDYKQVMALTPRSDKVRADLSKDVSAFANSAGGVLVYGIEEQGHLPRRIDGGVDPAVVTREWIENVISTNIQRRVDGIRINQIPLSTSSPGHVAYVVYVPQSAAAPHMANDKRYYKRFNFSSYPMEDYEVRDVGNRLSSPVLDCQFMLINPANITWLEGDQGSSSFTVRLNVQNLSPAKADYWLSSIYVDTRIRWAAVGGDYRENGPQEIMAGNKRIEVLRKTQNLGIPGNMPIWKGTNFNVGEFQWQLPPGDDRYLIAWSTSTPGSADTFGASFITVNRGQVNLTPANMTL